MEPSNNAKRARRSSSLYVDPLVLRRRPIIGGRLTAAELEVAPTQWIVTKTAKYCGHQVLGAFSIEGLQHLLQEIIAGRQTIDDIAPIFKFTWSAPNAIVSDGFSLDLDFSVPKGAPTGTGNHLWTYDVDPITDRYVPIIYDLHAVIMLLAAEDQSIRREIAVRQAEANRVFLALPSDLRQTVSSFLPYRRRQRRMSSQR